ncbi:alpha/beta fold hydrolase [Amycolatopsis sp. SID8362]|uniref:alpha/beta fold hydrolase n=1 Tax=Amycolatopsis sp. SID8362 TaxID=2690346 RepID=UPI0013708E99|nr:alpha/beta fold hydrolase [Amycolatopsis sp. SID8362]NBH11602.1 alpha/beta fold hydrolase [Amycolatopsis sp. SID8362]NED48294.1 alpha/beta fold hydrolase [Amycolatopsis sp. SID8362]
MTVLSYQEQGAGAPLVFLHGNPTSSQLWRNVMPSLPGRRLAPDLIGMGDSPRPDIEYTFDDHARYLDEWFDTLALDDVVLIGHDWGGALAADWAARHPSRVRALAFTEAVLKPMSWAEFPPAGAEVFRALKTTGASLIEDFVPPEYAFQDRRPLLQWARSMPLGGEPASVVARIEAFDRWLASSGVPKLLVTFEPGYGTMLTEPMIDWFASNFAALEVVRRPEKAGHHTPEDQPEALASTLAKWLADTVADGARRRELEPGAGGTG